MDLLTNGSKAVIAQWYQIASFSVNYAQYLSCFQTHFMGCAILQLDGAVVSAVEADPSGRS